MSSSSASSSVFGELVLIVGDIHIPERAYEIPPAFQRMLVPNKMQYVFCTGNSGSSDDIIHELQALVPPTATPNANFYRVAGDYDDPSDATNLPEIIQVQIGSFKIGMIHGHQLVPYELPPDSTTATTTTTTKSDINTTATEKDPTTVITTPTNTVIDRLQRKLKCDILITGHTHQSHITCNQSNHYYHINPGSLTGSDSSLVTDPTKSIIPSFILLAVQQDTVTCYLYELMNGKVEVSKTNFTKQQLQPNNSSDSTTSSIPTANPTLLTNLLK